MTKVAHGNRLHGRTNEQRYKEPESNYGLITEKTLQKPARITRRELGQVLSVLQRMAAGGDAACSIDAAACVPLLQRACASAPAGQPSARRHYSVTLPDGTVQQAHGLRAACKLIGRAQSTLANALNIGNGVAEFPSRDEHGNPALTRVEKVVPV